MNRYNMNPMKAIAAWFFVFRLVTRYLFFKLGVATAPDTSNDFDHIQYVCGQFSGWNRYYRYRGGENIPQDHPAIFCGNHIKFGDPFHVFRGAYLASDGIVKLHAMMRDDVFKGTPLKSRFFDADEFIVFVGVHGISRDNVSLSQMKVFLDLLAKGEGFIMFPGRTRSRSGLFMEYRDNFQEPGSVSFFLNMIQRKKKDMTFSAVPVTRNYNPVRNQTAMVYGPEQFLEAAPTREAQRKFDFELVGMMAGLVEICVVQVIATLLYTTALHHLAESISVDTMKKWVRTIRETSKYEWWDEEDDKNLDESVDLSLAWLEKHGMIQLRGDDIHLNTDAILSVPDLESDYIKQNPVKYLTNQNLHLGDHMQAVQNLVLKHFRK